MGRLTNVNLRRFVAVAMIAAALVTTAASGVSANGGNNEGGIAKGWAFILQFPSGNRNAVAVLTLQGGQLAGTAVIAGKRCGFKISGTFTGDDDTGGSFAMTWSGQRTCANEVLSLSGTVVNDEITGTFTDSAVTGGPFAFTGTVLVGDQGDQD